MTPTKRAALLVTDGFEQVELTSPKEALESAGIRADIISPKPDTVYGWKHVKWGDSFEVDSVLGESDPAAYDLLVLPGGVMNPDSLRRDEKAVAFAEIFMREDRPVAAICHGPQLLIEVEGALMHRRITSYGSIRTDLENAGAKWEDEAVVIDGNLITSRTPKDLEAFNNAIVQALQKT